MALQKLQFADFCNGWDGIRGYSKAATLVVLRYVPPANRNYPMWLYEDDFKNSEALNNYNESVKLECTLKVSPSDIKYVFVKIEDEIPVMVNHIMTFLRADEDQKYPLAEYQKLLSRVTSSETIGKDL